MEKGGTNLLLLLSAITVMFFSFSCKAKPTETPVLETKISGKVVAYSSDTEPCSQVIRMAEKADYLFHESSGLLHGHSSAMQAGDIANQAGVKVLYLIHYPTGEHPIDQLTSEAKQRFNGPVYLAEDFLSLDF